MKIPLQDAIACFVVATVFMKEVNTSNKLSDALSTLYSVPISDTDAREAANNLLGFMELLVEINGQHGLVSPENGK